MWRLSHAVPKSVASLPRGPCRGRVLPIGGSLMISDFRIFPSFPTRTRAVNASFECNVGSGVASEQFKAHDGKCYPDPLLARVGTRHCGRFFQDLPCGDVRSKGVFKQCSGSMRRRRGKGRGARPATCQEGADAGIAVLVGLSGSALGLLRYGFAIASPRNDAIPNDSRDGHLPCEE